MLLKPFCWLGVFLPFLAIRVMAGATRPNVLFILADDMGQWAARYGQSRLAPGSKRRWKRVGSWG